MTRCFRVVDLRVLIFIFSAHLFTPCDFWIAFISFPQAMSSTFRAIAISVSPQDEDSWVFGLRSIPGCPSSSQTHQSNTRTIRTGHLILLKSLFQSEWRSCGEEPAIVVCMSFRPFSLFFSPNLST
ncbi:hypothetical protein EDB83DRAFT_1742227 [Lactarius deliciosus]|nr:hypothetical protein EDB83DRAFT_1742227 [Lactarius deliciosus]